MHLKTALGNSILNRYSKTLNKASNVCTVKIYVTELGFFFSLKFRDSAERTALNPKKLIPFPR